MEVDYDVGFDGEGRLRGLRLRVRLLGGWAQDLATDDGVMLKDAGGMVLLLSGSGATLTASGGWALDLA